jgi:hypothetical protein
MSTEDEREKSPEWHRARANSLRKNGFTKMAKEHAASAGDRAPARAAAAGEIGRPVEGYGDLPSTAATANNSSAKMTRPPTEGGGLL